MLRTTELRSAEALQHFQMPQIFSCVLHLLHNLSHDVSYVLDFLGILSLSSVV